MSYPLQDIFVIRPNLGKRGITIQAYLDEMLEYANRGKGLFHVVLARIHRYGITDALVKYVNKCLAESSTTARPHLDAESQQLEWVVDMTGITESFENDRKTEPTRDDLIWMFYWNLAALISSGVFDKLKRCEDCRNFYIGGPRAKWCSNTCGSRNRARDKRKRDSQAGNYESRYL